MILCKKNVEERMVDCSVCASVKGLLKKRQLFVVYIPPPPIPVSTLKSCHIKLQIFRQLSSTKHKRSGPLIISRCYNRRTALRAKSMLPNYIERRRLHSCGLKLAETG